MLATGGTRDYAEPVVKQHADAYLYDICPGCGAEKRKASEVCADCRARQRMEAERREEMKTDIRHTMVALRALRAGDKDIKKVRVIITAPLECDLPEVMAEVVADVLLSTQMAVEA
jgi:hypothetical protein